MQVARQGMAGHRAFAIAARDGRARDRRAGDAAGRDPHARLHAGRHRRHGQGDAARERARHRRRRPARQHLPPDAAPGGGAGGAARRAAPLHELGAADPDRLGRLPGDEPDRAAQADRGGGHLPQPRRRRDAPPEPRAQHGDPAAARLRHRDGLRRVHAVPGDASEAAAASMRLSMRWARALARRRSATGRGTRSSASSRERATRTCGRRAPRRCRRSASTATRSAGSRSARGRRRCSRCSTHAPGSCPTTGRAT